MHNALTICNHTFALNLGKGLKCGINAGKKKKNPVRYLTQKRLMLLVEEDSNLDVVTPQVKAIHQHIIQNKPLRLLFTLFLLIT